MTPTTRAGAAEAAPVLPAGAIGATRISFLGLGLGNATFAPLVPVMRDNLGLDHAALGLLLLCFGIGSVTTMPLTGALVARFGCRSVILASTAMLMLLLPLLPAVASPAAAVALLLVFGAAIGALDVSVNAQALTVAAQQPKPVISGFHALFSAGGLVGALCLGGLLAVGVPPLMLGGVSSLLLAGFMLWARPGLVSHRSASAGPAFVVPRGRALLLGLLCFILFMTEGAMMDWSALFLSGYRDFDLAAAGLGYGAFSAAMASGRFAGDGLVRRFGERRVMVVGTLTAAVGLAITVALTGPSPAGQIGALAGFALVGLGASNAAPVLFMAAGRINPTAPGPAVASVVSLGYLGLLAGPAFIGFIAGLTTLPAALALVAVLLAMIACAAPFVTFATPAATTARDGRPNAV